jgi:hypothetical protein
MRGLTVLTFEDVVKCKRNLPQRLLLLTKQRHLPEQNLPFRFPFSVSRSNFEVEHSQWSDNSKRCAVVLVTRNQLVFGVMGQAIDDLSAGLPFAFGA